MSMTQGYLSSLKFLVKKIRLKAHESQKDNCLMARSLDHVVVLMWWQVWTSEAGTHEMP